MLNRVSIPARLFTNLAAAIGIVAFAGCAAVNRNYENLSGLQGHGPQWVGHSADTLVKQDGQPERQATAPSGATVYVYTWRSDKDVALCERQYFVRDGNVVGYLEKPIAIQCAQSAGKVN
ncbi:MAG: hypothetical protein WAN51_00065 [Alphaproteobacteria bacterium]